MRGHLRHRAGRPADYWELEVELPVDPVTRRRRRATRSFRGTKRDAERALTAFVAEVNQGRGTGTNATLGELLDRWMALAELEVTTRRRYRGLIDRHIAPALGAVPLRRLDASQLDQLYRDLLDKGLASRTVRQVHAVLRRSLGQAVKWGWLLTNTAAMATPPRIERTEITAPSPDVAVALVVAGRTWGDGTLGSLLYVAAATGARRGELCGLRWVDVDLELGELLIERSVVTGDDGRLIVKSTKTRAKRRIAVDAGTIGVLAEHRSDMTIRAGIVGETLVRDAFVWSDDLDGARPWRPDRVTQAFRKLCAREQVTNVRLHDLRHFSVTQLLAAGADARTVAGRHGHASTAVTLDVYGHFIKSRDREAADLLGGLLPGVGLASDGQQRYGPPHGGQADL